jgi:hypothetical protein
LRISEEKSTVGGRQPAQLGDLALEIDDRSLELEDLAIGHDGRLGHGARCC